MGLTFFFLVLWAILIQRYSRAHGWRCVLLVGVGRDLGRALSSEWGIGELEQEVEIAFCIGTALEFGQSGNCCIYLLS